MSERMVILPAPLVIGLTQKLVEVTQFAMAVWLMAAAFNVWTAFRVGGWGFLLLLLAAACCFAAWGGKQIRDEAQRLRDDIARQAGLIT